MIYHWGPNTDLDFPYESEFDCFKLAHASEGKVLKIDKFNFLGSALFNGKEIFRKVSIDSGIISISDFSKDVQIKPYDNWGEQKNGAKFEFSEGYKRLIWKSKVKFLSFLINIYLMWAHEQQDGN